MTVADVPVAVGFALAENTSASGVVEFQERVAETFKASFPVLATTVNARLLLALVNIDAVSTVRRQFISVVARTVKASRSVDASSMFANARIVAFQDIVAASQIFRGVKAWVANTSESSDDVQASAVLTKFIVFETFVVIFTSLLCCSDPVSLIAAASEASPRVDALTILTQAFLLTFIHIKAGNHVIPACETRIAVTRVASQCVHASSVRPADVSLAESVPALVHILAAFEILCLLKSVVTITLVVSASIDRSADSVLAARHRPQHLTDVVVDDAAALGTRVRVLERAKGRAFFWRSSWNGEAFSKSFLVPRSSNCGAATVCSLRQTVKWARAHLVLDGRVAIARSIEYAKCLVFRQSVVWRAFTHEASNCV